MVTKPGFLGNTESNSSARWAWFALLVLFHWFYCAWQAQLTQNPGLIATCLLPPPLQECFSNGTMTALAVKVESAPNLNPGQLTLSDPACGPTYSDDRFAYFHFTVNSCGTTRKVK